jgi:hypothetical protein
MWDAKRSNPYVFISPGERRKVATCEKVAEACIGILGRGDSEHVRAFYRGVQNLVVGLCTS